MSATDIPSSQHAAALRIIGATTSLPRSRACTGPTVVASSPVPSQALESTPVRTQRLSWMSWSRARSRPPYSSSFASGESRATTAARSGSRSTVARNWRTSAGSGFQSTYSGGSNAGKRFTEILLELLLDPGEEPAFRGPGERLGEFEGRRVAVVGVRFHRPRERLFEAGREVGPELPQGHRLAPEPGDHHLLGVAPLERQLPGEHLERHDAERVEVRARVELLAADLLGAHELGGPEDDSRR